MNHAVVLLRCMVCHDERLVLKTGARLPECLVCGNAPWTISARWTLSAASWWPRLDGHMMLVESPGDFLARLRYFSAHEHPAGPVGSRMICIGMQLLPTTAPNGDTTWSWCPTAGSEN